jgi:hypothetical protein
MIDPRDPNLAKRIDDYFDQQEETAVPQAKARGKPDNWNDLTPEQQVESRRERGRQHREESAQRQRDEVQERRDRGRGEDAPEGVQITDDLRRQLSGGGDGQASEAERRMIEVLEEISGKLDNLGGIA